MSACLRCMLCASPNRVEDETPLNGSATPVVRRGRKASKKARILDSIPKFKRRYTPLPTNREERFKVIKASIAYEEEMQQLWWEDAVARREARFAAFCHQEKSGGVKPPPFVIVRPADEFDQQQQPISNSNNSEKVEETEFVSEKETAEPSLSNPALPSPPTQLPPLLLQQQQQQQQHEEESIPPATSKYWAQPLIPSTLAQSEVPEGTRPQTQWERTRDTLDVITSTPAEKNNHNNSETTEEVAPLQSPEIIGVNTKVSEHHPNGGHPETLDSAVVASIGSTTKHFDDSTLVINHEVLPLSKNPQDSSLLSEEDVINTLNTQVLESDYSGVLQKINNNHHNHYNSDTPTNAQSDIHNDQLIVPVSRRD